MMPDNKSKKWKLFSKIITIEDALTTIKDCSYGFYFVAGLGFALGLLIEQMQPLVLDAIIIAILGVILHKFKSRVAAILLFLLTLLQAASTFYNTIHPEDATGGTNIFLAIIMVYCGIRSVQATFKYHKLIKV